jgi:hypothetical protein
MRARGLHRPPTWAARKLPADHHVPAPNPASRDQAVAHIRIGVHKALDHFSLARLGDEHRAVERVVRRIVARARQDELTTSVSFAHEPEVLFPPRDGFLFLDRSRFVASFADVRPDEGAFMAASQVPCGVGALSAAVTTPAWRTNRAHRAGAVRIVFSREHAVASLPLDRPDEAIPRGFTGHHLGAIARYHSLDGLIRTVLPRDQGRLMRRELSWDASILRS